MTNDTFIQRLTDGDQKAFKELFDEHSPKVFNLCLRILRSKEWAEDITQDVFIEVHSSIKNFKSRSSLGTWIYRIAMNKSLNFEKRQKRMLVMSKIGIVNKENIFEKEAFPGGNEEEKEKERWLFSKIEGLPKNQRMALTLSKLRGLKQEEVANILGTSISSVESLVFRAKKRIQEMAIKEGLNYGT